jgi:hypothetical protein
MEAPQPIAKRRVPFREADIARAIRGVKRAGLVAQSVKILPDGSILVSTGQGEATPDNAASAFDQWAAQNAH